MNLPFCCPPQEIEEAHLTLTLGVELATVIDLSRSGDVIRPDIGPNEKCNSCNLYRH